MQQFDLDCCPGNLKMEKLKFFISTLCLLFALSECSTKIETKLGQVEGFLSKSAGGKEFSSFAGIPYAKPPVGPRRFKRPVPVEPWKDIFQAKTYVQCLQYDKFRAKAVIGQEDCLVVNVYTPTIGGRVPTDLLPVMVYIHGGGFFMGSGSNDLYGPERFMDYDVVFVTVNYRIGVLGYLSTSDDIIGGNQGLWDQNLALKWVQENIQQFGGDPKQVTIFGESAGGMSVMYHYLSPQSRNLFRGAIAQSGVATSIFMKLDKNPSYYARTVAAKVGCKPESESQELLNCLQKVDPDNLQELTFMFAQLDLYPGTFKPVIDDFVSDPFVPMDPWDLIEKGDFNEIPLIIGNNLDEGLLSAYIFELNRTAFEELKSRWTNELGPTYMFQRELDEVDPEVVEICKEVSRKFFNGKDVPHEDDILHGLKDIIGDVLFNSIGSITARKISKKTNAPVYEYLYKHMGTLSFTGLMQGNLWKTGLKILGQFVGLRLFPADVGVCHFDENFLLFQQNKIPLNGVFSQEDKETSQNLLKIWTDFAKTGNPTPKSTDVKWESLSSSNKKRLEIGSGTLEMALDQDLENRIHFWEKIWAQLPPIQRLRSSKSWENKFLFKDDRPMTNSNAKNEL